MIALHIAWVHLFLSLCVIFAAAVAVALLDVAFERVRGISRVPVPASYLSYFKEGQTISFDEDEQLFIIKRVDQRDNALYVKRVKRKS